jgi:translation initiation factor IF-1
LNFQLSKEEGLRVEGTVFDILPNATFRVKVDVLGTSVLGVISGKMRKNNIRILLGDRVEIEFSPYDVSRGRIVRRR